VLIQTGILNLNGTQEAVRQIHALVIIFYKEEIFHGSFPNSEIEIKRLIEYIQTIHDLKIFMDIHSYSQLVMRFKIYFLK
jgi:hypothetical protein